MYVCMFLLPSFKPSDRILKIHLDAGCRWMHMSKNSSVKTLFFSLKTICGGFKISRERVCDSACVLIVESFSERNLKKGKMGF